VRSRGGDGPWPCICPQERVQGDAGDSHNGPHAMGAFVRCAAGQGHSTCPMLAEPQLLGDSPLLHPQLRLGSMQRGTWLRRLQEIHLKWPQHSCLTRRGLPDNRAEDIQENFRTISFKRDLNLRDVFGQ